MTHPGAARSGARIVLRPIGSPLPLGFLALAAARDVVTGTGMGVLAGAWLTVALVTLTSPPGSTSDALGLLLLISSVAMLVPAVTAALGKLVAAAVLGVTALRFALTGIHQLSDGAFWADAAGIVGLLLCALALYAALAMSLEDARRETVLPLLRRGPGRASVEGNLDDQLTSIESEAGVREQL